MTDRELLKQYATTSAQDAFAELVRRHVDVVYTAAVRQTRGDTDAAEEVTQRVFILLAGKAKKLAGDPHILLGGWLFNAVRFIARDVTRKAERRARHEQKAAEMAEHRRGPRASSEPQWTNVEGELDEAMSHLDEKSRGLIVLKFFEGKTAREVGDALGISEEAARKRMSRAVDELRQLFARRGVVMSASGLAEGLTAIAMLKAPEGLAAASASAATAAATTSTGAGLLSGGVIMASAKAKTLALVAAALLLTGGAVTVAPKFFSPVSSRTVKLAQDGPTMTGIVLGPDGKPAANAEVRVATTANRRSPYVGPRDRDRADGVTDASGKYVVPKPIDERPVLVITAPDGYAEASWKQLARGEPIKLEPWGRIEGVAYANGKPQPKANVRLWRVGENDELVSHQTSVTADANGKFVIPRVAPGGTQLYRTLRPNNWRSTDWRYVEIQPGKTTTVRLGGGGGASVAGRVEVPPDVAKLVSWKENGTLSYEANVRLDIDRTARPKHAKVETPEEYRAIEEAFARTPEGLKYKEWLFGRTFEVNPDGTFRIDDLPPGKYAITIRHFEEQPEVNFLEDVAKTEFTFEIPAPTATQPTRSEPIDLGTAITESLKRVRPGDAAPDISVTTIDGRPWRLADQKGKVFVLVCWGAHSERQEQKSFTELAAKYGKDPRVAILGCFSAETVDEARPHIERLKLDFPHTSDVKLMNLYDNSWPSAVLVGRDGKIVQKHLSEQNLMRYVQAVVDTDKPPPPATKPARRR